MSSLPLVCLLPGRCACAGRQLSKCYCLIVANVVLATCMGWWWWGDETPHGLCTEASNLPWEVRHFFLAPGRLTEKHRLATGAAAGAKLSVCSAVPMPVGAWIRCPKGTACGAAALKVCWVLLWLWGGGGNTLSCLFLGCGTLLAAQWAGEALTLFPLRHQLQSACKLGLAHSLS